MWLLLLLLQLKHLPSMYTHAAGTPSGITILASPPGLANHKDPTALINSKTITIQIISIQPTKVPSLHFNHVSPTFDTSTKYWGLWSCLWSPGPSVDGSNEVMEPKPNPTFIDKQSLPALMDTNDDNAMQSKWQIGQAACQPPHLATHISSQFLPHFCSGTSSPHHKLTKRNSNSNIHHCSTCFKFQIQPPQFPHHNPTA